MDIATCRSDGSLRKPRVIWVVRVGDGLYVRTVNGPDAASTPDDLVGGW